MSIRIRLTIWYVSLLGSVLVMFGVAFFGVLKYSLTKEIDRSLQERAEQVVIGIGAQNDTLDILRSGMINLPELDVFSSRSVYIQIANAQGIVTKRSPNLMGHNLPMSEDVLSILKTKQPSYSTIPVGTLDMRLYSVPLVFGSNVVGMVQVANPINETQETLQRVLLFLISGTILSMVVATIFGVLMVQLSLRPIEKITEAAKQIVSAEDLGQRLPIPPIEDELARLSRTINHMLRRLDNLFQSQVRLTADVSHELRTPLTIVRGNVDMLQRANNLTEENRESVIAIDSASSRMTRLVSDLLLLSQADAGMLLKMKSLDLDGVILDVLHQVQAIRNGVNLKLGQADPARVIGDEDRLKQLLINLMENAIKHTPTSGCVTLSVKQIEQEVKVTVSDTGEGISPENLPHIFERFYRVKGQKVKGSGLGLAIAKWIAEAHHGTLTVESILGQGSTFTFTLPIVDK